MIKNRRQNKFTIGLYNVENLFDTIDNPLKADDHYTPNGKHKWNKKRYFHKIKKISSVISQIGITNSNIPPVIMGLVEVENSSVVKNLITHKNLKKHNYNFIHYDSNDERGIDVSLLYKKDAFVEISSKTYSLPLKNETGKIDYTRDILLVEGKLYNEHIYIILNHWPSRREGEEVSAPKRIKAAKLVHTIIEEIKVENSNPKVIIMGDFNDNPNNKSVKDFLVTKAFFNPMRKLHEEGKGTLTYYNEWHLFDQIILSKNFFDSESSFSYLKAAIFSKDWMRTYRGKFKNSPFRTYIGPWHKGGFSDHFPVYLTFEKDR